MVPKYHHPRKEFHWFPYLEQDLEVEKFEKSGRFGRFGRFGRSERFQSFVIEDFLALYLSRQYGVLNICGLTLETQGD